MKISVVIPIHWMKNWQFFLTRCLESIEKQTFKDYEVILTKAGSMPVNTNRAIQCAKGELIKVLYMDDWLNTPYYLAEIYRAFLNPEIDWLITSSVNNRHPIWTDDIETGNNKLGSPSVLAFRNNFEDNLLFDEELSWLLDCDLYKRMEKKFGKPAILTDVDIGIGIHDGQMTNKLSHEEKFYEQQYLQQKYGK